MKINFQPLILSAALVMCGDVVMAQSANEAAEMVGRTKGQVSCAVMKRFGVYENWEVESMSEVYGGSLYRAASDLMSTWRKMGRWDLIELVIDARVKYGVANCPSEIIRFVEMNRR